MSMEDFDQNITSGPALHISGTAFNCMYKQVPSTEKEIKTINMFILCLILKAQFSSMNECIMLSSNIDYMLA